MHTNELERKKKKQILYRAARVTKLYVVLPLCESECNIKVDKKHENKQHSSKGRNNLEKKKRSGSRRTRRSVRVQLKRFVERPIYKRQKRKRTLFSPSKRIGDDDRGAKKKHGIEIKKNTVSFFVYIFKSDVYNVYTVLVKSLSCLGFFNIIFVKVN